AREPAIIQHDSGPDIFVHVHRLLINLTKLYKKSKILADACLGQRINIVLWGCRFTLPRHARKGGLPGIGIYQCRLVLPLPLSGYFSGMIFRKILSEKLPA